MSTDRNSKQRGSKQDWMNNELEKYKPLDSKRKSIPNKQVADIDNEEDEQTSEEVEQRKIQFDAAIKAELPPYKMAAIESRELQEFKNFPDRYCEIRNTILAKWNEDILNYLPKEKALDTFLVGTKREASKVYDFLERWGYINFGIFAMPEGVTFAPATQEKMDLRQSKKVVIIGAGMSGVAAAKQLTYLGYNVTVLEARNRHGGRVYTDTETFGGSVDLGGSVILGLEGNPLTPLCKQLRLTLHHLKPDCPLYDYDGCDIPSKLDDRLSRELNIMLNNISQRGNNTLSLEDGVKEQFKKADRSYNRQESRIMNWHFANLEYGCAGQLSEIAMVGWDQDDPYAFHGEHCMIKEGYGAIVNGLVKSSQLNIIYNSEVEHIEYCPDNTKQTKIRCSNGTLHFADCCIVTIPLGVLKTSMVEFSPQLPLWKTKIIERLGFGTLNKVILKFPRVFWGDQDYFGILNEEEKCRGEGFMFWNLKRIMGENVLVALASGASSKQVEEADEKYQIERIMKKLRKRFGRDIPDPIATKITKWSKEKYSGGTYSFIAVKSSGADYDMLSHNVGNLYFAGEATCKEHPATVAGALISGVREAGRIDKEFCSALDKLDIINVKDDYRERKKVFSNNYQGHNPKKQRGKVRSEIGKRSHSNEADSWLFTGYTIPKISVGKKLKTTSTTTTTTTTTTTFYSDDDNYSKSSPLKKEQQPSTSSTSSSSSLTSTSSTSSPSTSTYSQPHHQSSPYHSQSHYPPSNYHHHHYQYPPPSSSYHDNYHYRGGYHDRYAPPPNRPYGSYGPPPPPHHHQHRYEPYPPVHHPHPPPQTQSPPHGPYPPPTNVNMQPQHPPPPPPPQQQQQQQPVQQPLPQQQPQPLPMQQPLPQQQPPPTQQPLPQPPQPLPFNHPQTYPIPSPPPPLPINNSQPPLNVNTNPIQPQQPYVPPQPLPSTSKNSGAEPQTTQQEAQQMYEKQLVSNLVIPEIKQTCSNLKIKLASDDFKQLARLITHTVITKEKNANGDKPITQITSSMKRLIHDQTVYLTMKKNNGKM